MITFKFNNINVYVSGPNHEIAPIIDSMSFSVKGAYYSEAYKNHTRYLAWEAEKRLKEENGIEVEEENPFEKVQRWDGKKSFYHSKYDYFPTGLLPIAVAALKRDDIPFRFVDARPEFSPVEEYGELDLSVTLEDYQRAAMEAFLKHRRGIIKLPARSGKTVLSIACVQKLNVKTLFIAPSIDLVKQTRDEYKDKGNLDVGIISEGTFEPKQVTISLVHSIDALLKTKNKELFDRVKRYLEEVEFVIFDEVHGISNRYKKIGKLLRSARYRLGLSATPSEGGKEKKLNAMSLTGDIIYQVKMQKLVEKKKIAKPTIYFVNCETPKEYYSWNEEYDEGIVNNEERNLKIALIARKYYEKRRKATLILIERVEHGEILLNLLKEKLRCVFISGKDDGAIRRIVKWDFESSSIDVLITSRIFNQGVNIPFLQVVINAAGYKSPIQSIQKWSRGSTKTDDKEETTVIDFYDTGSKNLEKHSVNRLKLAQKESAFTVKIVDYEDFGKKEIWPI